MNWHKEVEIQPLKEKYNREDGIILWGSCFAQEVYEHLRSRLYKVHFSPYGIMYNPLSMAKGLRNLLMGNAPISEDLFQHQNLWHSPMHHGSYSAPGQEEALQLMQVDFQTQRVAIPETKLWVFTFGTAYIYEWATPPHDIVNNCHRVPAKYYIRRRASVEEIIEAWKPLIAELTSHNSEVVFTISPIPHYRDGAHQSRVSKATLLLSIEELISLPHVHYFPSYEIQIDELRDYRFYKDDMAHPTKQAVNYIIERFTQYALQPMDDIALHWQRILPQLAHRPLSKDPREATRYYLRLQKELEEMYKKAPHPYIKEQLNAIDQKLLQ